MVCSFRIAPLWSWEIIPGCLPHGSDAVVAPQLKCMAWSLAYYIKVPAVFFQELVSNLNLHSAPKYQNMPNRSCAAEAKDFYKLSMGIEAEHLWNKIGFLFLPPHLAPVICNSCGTRVMSLQVLLGNHWNIKKELEYLFCPETVSVLWAQNTSCWWSEFEN